MRIVFFGTPEFAVPSLLHIVESSHDVAAVVTQPDKPKGRAKTPVPSAVKLAAQKKGLDLFQPLYPGEPSFLSAIRTLQPDCGVVVAYGRILPAALLNIFPKGVINLHPSLLPKYRGAAPMQWALIRGETETGVTIFRLDEQLDHGPMILQVRQLIDPQDNAVTLGELLSTEGARALIDALELIESGKALLHPQDDRAATLAPPLKKEDGFIRWEESAISIHNRVRGVQPWPGAATEANGKILKLFSTFPDPSRKAPGKKPGTVISADSVHGLWVQTGTGHLRIDQLQIEGGTVLDTESFLRGRPVPPGTLLTLPKPSL